MLALIVSEHHCDWQQHCLVLGPGKTLPERCILLLPARRYQQEVNYSDMFTPATTKRNQRRSPLAAQNYRLTDGRTVRSAIWRRQSTHRPPRACPLPTLDAGAAASRARDEHRPLLSKHCAPQRAADPSGHRRGARLECCTAKCPANSANRARGARAALLVAEPARVERTDSSPPATMYISTSTCRHVGGSSRPLESVVVSS